VLFVLQSSIVTIMDSNSENDFLEEDYYSVLNLPKSVSQFEIHIYFATFYQSLHDNCNTEYSRQHLKRLRMLIDD